MAIRKVVHIDEKRCNGCGLCIPNCAEGALKIIDGKAKLVSYVYCDGLGACLGHCPQDAISVIEREADEFDEAEVHKYLANEKEEHIINERHVEHQGCPGSSVRQFNNGGHQGCPGSAMRQFGGNDESNDVKISSKLRQWPVQLSLVPPNAPYLKGADLLITADCVPFAYGNYHNDFLKGRAVVVGCPKLDDVDAYVERLTDIIVENELESITVLRMQVPCCGGISYAAMTARDNSGVNIPIKVVTIGIEGNIIKKEWI
jgi:ferredoxin